MATDDDYTVGYGKPPRHTQFQKGRSGNPAGRPKQSTAPLVTLERVLGSRLGQDASPVPSMQVTEVLLRSLIRAALNGKVPAFKKFVKLLQQSGLLRPAAAAAPIRVVIPRSVGPYTVFPEATPEPAPDSAADSTVGYCKPPTAHRFRPGESGNPAGRPPDDLSVVALLTRLLKERIPVRVDGRARTLPLFDALLHKMVALSVNGDVSATDALLALTQHTTLFGKPITPPPAASGMAIIPRTDVKRGPADDPDW